MRPSNKTDPRNGVLFLCSGSDREKRKEGYTNEDTEEEGDGRNSSEKQHVVYWPAISYWMAVQSQNGTHVSTVPVHSALLEI